MKYTVQALNDYFLVLDSYGQTVKVYPERISADTLCTLLNKEVAA
jgi:hypothetical protein